MHPALGLDGRVKPGHDERGRAALEGWMVGAIPAMTRNGGRAATPTGCAVYAPKAAIQMELFG